MRQINRGNERQFKQLTGVKRKRAELSEIFQNPEKESADLAKEAERKHNFTLLSNSNALRQKAEEMAEQVKTLRDKKDELARKWKEM